MKKLIFLLLLLPIGLIAQSNSFDPYSIAVNTTSVKFKSLFVKADSSFSASELNTILPPLPAAATITITITDSGAATLADIRDNLCVIWGYTGAANDNAAKLAFLKGFLVNKIINDYGQQKAISAAQAAQAITTQVNVQ
jgi:hypothetical protein